MIQNKSHSDYPDHDTNIRKRVLSVNYSLFGSSSDIDQGESTIEFLFSSRSQHVSFEEILDTFDFLTLSEKQMLEKEITSSQAYKILTDDIIGNLILISIPCDKIEKYVYNSAPYGFVTATEIVSMIKRYLSVNHWGDFFYDIYDNSQARIVDLCYEKYGRADGIQITTIESIPANLRKNIQNIIYSIVK